MITFLIVFLAIFIICSALLSASETALFSLSSMKIRSFEQSLDKRKKLVAQLLSKPGELLVTILMLNVLMNILIQNTVSGIFGSYSGWISAVGVPLLITLIFGEVIPKTIAILLSEKIAFCVAPFLRGTKYAFGPLRFALSKSSGFISRIIFFFLKKQPEISLDELRHTLQTSRDFGVLGREEAKLIRGYLNLEEITVKEIMRPRGEIIFFNLDEPLSHLIHLFVDQECSRIPICEKNLENLKGIMTSKNFFLHQKMFHQSKDLISFIEPAFFVPESMKGKQLLSQLKEKEISLAIVLDEYGIVSGLITLEDLVEVVIGQIADRRDEKILYTRASSDVVIASGKLELTEFEELFEIPLESKANMVTLGGWLTEQIGDIPKTGDKLEKEGFLFHILASDPHRVRRVYIRKLHPKKALKKALDIK